ncbi:MAG: DegT/DnrJ/EryC1/StrS family aminotransferase [Cyclobacteriaceae bacterium]|jgi:dTDP-4-amino-4,6-dideoxygalactose transaminase
MPVSERVPFLNLADVNASYDELPQAVQRVVRQGNYIRGSEMAAFEREFATYIGSRFAIGTGNGFDALHLIFRAYLQLGTLREGDEVLVPACTHIATVLAVVHSGLRPVLVEPEATTFLIDANQAERQITASTRAVVVVHLYGQNAVNEQIQYLAKKHSLLLIEDNAQAAGCGQPGKRTGSLGHAAAHSFYPTKNLGALGDGGAVTTSDTELATVIRALGNYGSIERDHFQWPGFNSRLDDVQAAVLRAKLRHLDRDNQRRRQLAERYLAGIRNPDIILPVAKYDHAWHLFVIRHPERDWLRQALADQGIGTMIHYPVPPHRQPALSGFSSVSLPLTEQIHNTVLSLPLNTALTNEHADTVIDVLNSVRL